MTTFIGQAFASVTMSCQTMSSQPELQEQMMSSAHMNHSQNMNMASADSNSPECNTACDCIGGCAVAVMPVSQQVFVASLSILVNNHATLAEKQLASSLYRPPISR